MSNVIPFDPVTLKEQSLTWPEKAKALTVTSDVSYVAATEMLKGIKALRSEVDRTFDPIIAAAHHAHKEACSQKRLTEAPLTEAESIIKAALVRYQQEQERVRAAEEARLRELARQQEEARVIEEALTLEADGRDDEADALLLEATIASTAVILPSFTPKVAGISFREAWKFRVVDTAKVPREYTRVDEVKVGGVVRALKGNTNIPGIEVYCETVAAAGK
jgi:hypothetical protein